VPISASLPLLLRARVQPIQPRPDLFAFPVGLRLTGIRAVPSCSPLARFHNKRTMTNRTASPTHIVHRCALHHMLAQACVTIMATSYHGLTPLHIGETHQTASGKHTRPHRGNTPGRPAGSAVPRVVRCTFAGPLAPMTQATALVDVVKDRATPPTLSCQNVPDTHAERFSHQNPLWAWEIWSIR